MNTTNYGLSPDEDKERIKALRSYDIIDSQREQEYDDITELAAMIFDVPMALVTFIDKDRQWFKSAYGLEGSETHRQYAFCSHTILNPAEPLIVEDSRLDDRFKDNPYVKGEPHVIFYAGVPLVSDNGHGLGSFCILDSKPRTLTEKQVNGLKILARQVMNLMEIRKKTAELNVRAEALEMRGKNIDKIVNEKVAAALKKAGK